MTAEPDIGKSCLKLEAFPAVREPRYTVRHTPKSLVRKRKSGLRFRTFRSASALFDLMSRTFPRVSAG
jgi:hypothetical protein